MAILTHVIGLARARLVPLTASLELTTACNLRCVHCYLEPRRAPELTTAQWLDALRQLQQLGTLYLSVTGGEVFVREDLLELLGAARRLRFSVSLLSNATLIDDRVAAALARLAISAVKVSLYADRALEHDAVTGRPGSHAATLAGVAALRRHGVPLQLQAVVLRDNVRRLPALARLARRLGVAFRYTLHLQAGESGSLHPLALAVDAPLFDQAIPAGSPAAALLHPEGHAFHDEPAPPSGAVCGAGLSNIHIDAHGNVLPCDTWPRLQRRGNLSERGLAEIWHGGEDFQWLRGPEPQDPCAGCEARGLCSHCYAEGLGLSGDPHRRLDHRCRVGRLLQQHGASRGRRA